MGFAQVIFFALLVRGDVAKVNLGEDHFLKKGGVLRITALSPPLRSGEAYNFELKILNRFEQPLKVSNGVTDCSCTSAVFNFSHLNPGESGLLTMRIDVPKVTKGDRYVATIGAQIKVGDDKEIPAKCVVSIPLTNFLSFGRQLHTATIKDKKDVRFRLPFTTSVKEGDWIVKAKDSSLFQQLAVKPEKNGLGVVGVINVSQLKDLPTTKFIEITDKVTGATAETKILIQKFQRVRASPRTLFFKKDGDSWTANAIIQVPPDLDKVKIIPSTDEVKLDVFSLVRGVNRLEISCDRPPKEVKVRVSARGLNETVFFSVRRSILEGDL